MRQLRASWHFSLPFCFFFRYSFPLPPIPSRFSRSLIQLQRTNQCNHLIMTTRISSTATYPNLAQAYEPLTSCTSSATSKSLSLQRQSSRLDMLSFAVFLPCGVIGSSMTARATVLQLDIRLGVSDTTRGTRLVAGKICLSAKQYLLWVVGDGNGGGKQCC